MKIKTSASVLRKIVEAIHPSGGVIVRTAGEGATETSLRFDIEYLHRLWQEIQRNYEKKSKSGLVHAEPDVELRALRDLLNEDVEKVIVDDEESFKKVTTFITQFMPKFKNKVSLYKEARPLFDIYEIDLEISRSLERRSWLKSGGYIVIDEAEALVVIDVNTGKFVGKKDFEDTILKTNLEAVREIAHQLRIRNCGGHHHYRFHRYGTRSPPRKSTDGSARGAAKGPRPHDGRLDV